MGSIDKVGGRFLIHGGGFYVKLLTTGFLSDRTAFLFLFFPSLLLVLRSWLWGGLPVQLYQAWLLILYTGLALRENILRVNGSDIRPWWIKHHYFAMAMALISLTWEIEREPDCSQKQTVHVLCREGCNCSFNGLSCKELQCFYKIDINGKGFVHILHSQVYFACVSALGCVLFVKPCRPAWFAELQ
ncbi:hypothetical protein CsSME_00001747 [Camellia sinensis var. sinensis]